MGARLDAIYISNFKSFVGRWNLTPLMPWNVIMGPNGSGKSSLIDAITFGLGENENSQLRINNLTELIPPTSTQESRTFIRLTLSSKKDLTVFERSLVKISGQLGYESQYTINKQVVDIADYLERLKALGIDINAKDFVVYQGSINGIIDASPQDRRRMLEIASGSIAFKERYDQLTREFDAIHEIVVKETATKRKLNSEMNKYKEADRKLKQLKLRREEFQVNNAEYYLLQLKIIDLKNEKLNQEALSRTASSRIDEAKEKTRDLQKSLEQVKERQEQFLEQSQKLDKLKAELCKKINENSDYEIEIEKLKKSLRAEEKLQEAIDDLDSKIEEYEKLLQMYSRELRRDNDARVSEYEGEYQRLQKNIQQQMSRSLATNDSKIRQERKINAELELLNKKGLHLEKLISDHQNSITRNENSLENYRHDCQTISETVKQLEKEKHEKSRQLLSKEEIAALKSRRQKIEEDLETIRVCSEKRRGEERKREALVKLKLKFPESVHDRIANLCQILQDKYKMAVAAALDKNLDTIVVEDDATATACLEYLEQEKIGFETFHSIGGASPPALDKNLPLKINSVNTKLVYNLLKFDQQYEPVIRSVVRSTILCDTLEDAWAAMQSMKSMRKNVHNVVTLAGEILTSRFVVSAGFCERKIQSERIKTVTEAQLAAEKQSIVQKLICSTDGSLKMDVQKTIAELELKLRCLTNLKTFIRETEKKNETLQAELEDLMNQRQQIQEKKIILEKKREDFIIKGEHFQRKMDELRGTIFAEFCQEFGVDNIKDFETMLASKNERMEKKKVIENQLADLKSLMREDKSRSRAKEVPKWNEKLQKLKKKQKVLQLQFNKLKEETEDYNSSVKKLEAILEEETEQLNEVDGKRKELFNFSHRNDRKSRKVSRLREQLAIKRHEILSAARFECVSLPELEPDSLSSSQSSVEDNQKKFNYSSLRSDWRTSKAIDHLEKQLALFRETVEQSRVDDYQLSGTEVVEKLSILKSKLREVDTRLASQKKREQLIAREMRDIDKDRSDAFIPFFNKVMSVIDNICKEMYNDPSAHAILAAENPSEPYQDGIRYDCTPARKQYRNAEKLSSGEKAMAGLIFLFALQESRLSSFVILDEVDGALDPKFVGGFVNYLKKLRRKHQIFMISHNPMINMSAHTWICSTPNISSGELESVPIMVDHAGKFRNSQ